MGNENRTELFNRWAADYDLVVQRSDGKFPFDGYERVLDTLVELAQPEPNMLILDVGAGTGNVAARFVEQTVWAIDFSPKMIAQAQAKLPQVQFRQANLSGEWWVDLPEKFDRIVAGYVLHEFPLSHKIKLIQQFAECLNAGGQIVVGDIAFPTVAIREQKAVEWAARWDSEEFYWAADETLNALPDDFSMDYRQVSSCAGVLVIKPR